MDSQPTVVFLHGAGTGAWVWDRVTQALDRPAIALEVPGRTVGATPDGCASQLVEQLYRQGIGSVTVVLHSLAGVLAPALAARLWSRLSHCIFVSAVIPPAGQSFIDTLGIANRLILRVLFAFNRGGLKPSPAMIRNELCNDLSEEDAAMVVTRYAAEMPGLYLTPVGDLPSALRCGYVKLLQDRSVLPAQQNRMITRLGNPCVHEIDAGHLAMLSTPTLLAELLQREA